MDCPNPQKTNRKGSSAEQCLPSSRIIPAWPQTPSARFGVVADGSRLCQPTAQLQRNREIRINMSIVRTNQELKSMRQTLEHFGEFFMK